MSSCEGRSIIDQPPVFGLETKMVLGSNVPGTVFRVREQRLDAGPEEGWVEAGTGRQAVATMLAGLRYEIAAQPPGYRERRVKLTEPLKRYDFHFLQADRLPGGAFPRQLAEPGWGGAEGAPSPGGPSASPTPEQASSLDFGRYYAVVIGNDEYQHLRKLTTAENDADAVAALLRDRYDFEVSLLKNATREMLISAGERMREKLTAGDNLLIYYAGHGYYDADTQRGYWLPVDASEHSRANWVSNADITDSLRALTAKHVMVVADSCYSGTLTRGVSIANRTPDYLLRMARKRARVVLTSGGLEPVADEGRNGHSVFANAFMRALRENEEILDGSTLFSRIRRPVMVNSPQTPEYGDIRFTGHEGGDFLFVPQR